jgi:hypothetical protein
MECIIVAGSWNLSEVESRLRDGCANSWMAAPEFALAVCGFEVACCTAFPGFEGGISTSSRIC